ncbi:MAG: hypothetical protein ABS76_23230 [Pelagibacterium sp. SCN 64-44]|nr:MAG: hypothetical protein ABS76_23230 [Pelagibacterium sp. SCN 64-44]
MAAAADDPRHRVDPRVLEMLVCPLTKTRLMLSADRGELISIAARLAFPIVRGVPLLSLEEARTIEPDELDRLSRQFG